MTVPRAMYKWHYKKSICQSVVNLYSKFESFCTAWCHAADVNSHHIFFPIGPSFSPLVAVRIHQLPNPVHDGPAPRGVSPIPILCPIHCDQSSVWVFHFAKVPVRKRLWTPSKFSDTNHNAGVIYLDYKHWSPKFNFFNLFVLNTDVYNIISLWWIFFS